MPTRTRWSHISIAAAWSGASRTSGVLSFSGFDHPGAEAGGGLAGRDVHRAGDGALVDLGVGAGVHEDDLVRGEIRGDVGGVQLGQGCTLAHDGGAFTVFALHAGEVGVGVGLAVEEFVDEALLVVGRQVRAPPGVEAFVADSGGRDGAEGLAAGAAGAVAGVDLDVVRQGEELIPQAGEELLGTFEAGVDAAGGLVEQVRAAQVAGEHEVTGEQVAGLVGERAVGDQEGEVLRGVARGVEGLDGDVAQGDLVIVVQALGVEAVLPVSPALAGDVRGGAGRGRQLAGAGEEVGVDVGLGHGHDLHPVRGSKVQVDGNVTAGVDHQGLTLGLAANEVAGLCEVFVIDALDKHWGALLAGGRGKGSFRLYPQR